MCVGRLLWQQQLLWARLTFNTYTLKQTRINQLILTEHCSLMSHVCTNYERKRDATRNIPTKTNDTKNSYERSSLRFYFLPFSALPLAHIRLIRSASIMFLLFDTRYTASRQNLYTCSLQRSIVLKKNTAVDRIIWYQLSGDSLLELSL